MMHGRNNGKKLMAVRIVKHAMEIIHLLTDLNPIQVIVDAIINRYVLMHMWILIATHVCHAHLNLSAGSFCQWRCIRYIHH